VSWQDEPHPTFDAFVRATTSELRERGTAFVLDASALLALIQEEPGAELVELVLSNAVIGAVNWSEVVQKCLAREIDVAGMRGEFEMLGLLIDRFGPEDAQRAAELWPRTRHLGLSLGDRACLALAQEYGIPVLTADRAWQNLDLGIPIQQVR
jgi:ribonuclease VapC